MFEIGTVLSKGFEGFKANLVPWILGMVVQGAVMAVIYVLFIVISVVLAQVADFLPLIAMLVMIPVLIVAITVLQMGLISMALKSARGQQVAVGDLFSQVGKLVPGVIAAVIAGLPSIIPCVGWLISFAFFGLALFYVVDKSLDPISAVKASMAATEPARMQMVILCLVFFGLGLLMVIPLAGLVIVPTILVTLAHVYELLASKGVA